MLFVLIACVYAYAHITNGIIKDQDKQIARLNTEVFRLQAKLHRANRRETPKVIDIRDKTVDPENVPDFKKIW
jgi:hypothetical protein